jgi:hypothetical protein
VRFFFDGLLKAALCFAGPASNCGLVAGSRSALALRASLCLLLRRAL